jgi:uncharacterized protein (DUF2062 family)
MAASDKAGRRLGDNSNYANDADAFLEWFARGWLCARPRGCRPGLALTGGFGMNGYLVSRRATANRALHRLRTGKDTPARQAAAVGLGTFIGCSPAFGFHLPLCLVSGWLLGLNCLKVYLAANLSNPFVAPFLVFAEVQIGRCLRAGAPYPLSLEAFRTFNLWHFGVDLVLGSLVLGIVLGVAATSATYALVRRHGTTEAVARLFAGAVDRYVESGAFAWESANGKLRLDPVYRQVLRQGMLPDAGTLVDLGCGRGLMLALLVSARDCWREGKWPDGWPAPPTRLSLRGLELRPRIAADASRALAGHAVVDQGDIRTFDLPPTRAVLMFDVLHMLPYEEQDKLLARIVKALEPGGVLILREADAAGGWRFRIIHIGNWLKGLWEGDPGRRFCFRSTSGWTERLEALGLTVRVFPLDERTPFANILIEART